jgi:hypothetical protein
MRRDLLRATTKLIFVNTRTCRGIGGVLEVKWHETDCRLWRLEKGGVQFRVHASIAHLSDVENDPASERRIQHDFHTVVPFFNFSSRHV